MKKVFKYIFIGCLMLSSLACRKKTTIKVKVFNPALNERVSNATVVLVEKKGEGGGGIFGGSSECKEIESSVTDANGECFFDKEKLRSNGKYNYFCAVTESWGIKQSYPCGGKSSDYIKKGEFDEWLITDLQDGQLKVQYNNLLQPSQPGDSLNILIENVKYFDPFDGRIKGGGGVLFGSPSFGDNGFPYPAVSILPLIDCMGGKYVVRMFRRKMGINYKTIDTIKVFPNQITKYVVNW